MQAPQTSWNSTAAISRVPLQNERASSKIYQSNTRLDCEQKIIAESLSIYEESVSAVSYYVDHDTIERLRRNWAASTTRWFRQRQATGRCQEPEKMLRAAHVLLLRCADDLMVTKRRCSLARSIQNGPLALSPRKQFGTKKLGRAAASKESMGLRRSYGTRVNKKAPLDLVFSLGSSESNSLGSGS